MDEAEIEDITKHHVATYRFESERGTFTLRPISRLEHQRTLYYVRDTFPEFKKLCEDKLYYEQVRGYAEAMTGEDVGLSEEQERELAVLNDLLAPWMDWFMVRCFEEPKISYPEQLHAISNELPAEEWAQLEAMLGVLAHPHSVTEREAELGRLAVALSLPLAEGLTVENITEQQATVLEHAMAEEQENLKQIMEAGLGDGG